MGISRRSKLITYISPVAKNTSFPIIELLEDPAVALRVRSAARISIFLQKETGHAAVPEFLRQPLDPWTPAASRWIPMLPSPFLFSSPHDAGVCYFFEWSTRGRGASIPPELYLKVWQTTEQKLPGSAISRALARTDVSE